MSRMTAMLFLCFLAWLACAAFVGAATYLYYILGVKDVTPLLLGAFLSGSGASWLTKLIVEGEK